MVKSKVINKEKEVLGKVSKSKKRMVFNSKEAKYLWKRSDDAICTTRMLSEIYSNVPKKLDVVVHVLEFHKFVCNSKGRKKEVLKWLDKK